MKHKKYICMLVALLMLFVSFSAVISADDDDKEESIFNKIIGGTGTIKKVNVFGDVYLLEAKDSIKIFDTHQINCYLPLNLEPEFQEDGLEVEFTGKINLQSLKILSIKTLLSCILYKALPMSIGDIEITGGIKAGFEYIPEVPLVGDTVQFKDTSKGNIVEWKWYFGETDCDPFDTVDCVGSTEQNPTYEFQIPGMHTVTLTVKNKEGETDSINKEIRVREKPETPSVIYGVVLEDEITVDSGEKGKPIPDALVVIKSIYDASGTESMDSNKEYTTRTDIIGKYKVEVEPGSYIVIASKEGYGKESKETTVLSGKNSEVNFALEKDEEEPETFELILSANPSKLTDQVFTLLPEPIETLAVLDGKIHAIYEEGTEVNIFVEESKDEYVFDHWTGDADGDKTHIKFTMDGDKEAVAHYVAVSPCHEEPFFSIDEPSEGEVVKGEVEIKISFLQENPGQLEISIDKGRWEPVRYTLECPDNGCPLYYGEASYSWDTTQYSDGEHVISARLKLQEGKQLVDGSISVIVKNKY